MGDALITFVLGLGVSDCAEWFPGWVPYLRMQFFHAVLGLIAGAVSLVFAVPFFVLWTLKEVLFDNFANGGSTLVALDSVADLTSGCAGFWLADCRREAGMVDPVPIKPFKEQGHVRERNAGQSECE
jgi:hypothetical protein